LRIVWRSLGISIGACGIYIAHQPDVGKRRRDGQERLPIHAYLNSLRK